MRVLILSLIVAVAALMTTGRALAQNPPATPIESPRSPGTESPIRDVLEPRREEGGAERDERRERQDEIETDRDSFTPAVTVVGRNRLVIESAYSFIENRRAKETHSFPELLFRFGILERVELRFGFNYEADGVIVEEGKIVRETNLSYGLKVQVSKQREWLPDSIVIVQGFTPTSGPDPATQYIVTYACGWELPNKWKLDAALRYSEDSERGDRFNIWAPSIVLKVPFCERWAAHVEYFGEMSSGREEEFSRQFISPGVHYLVNPNFEVGVRGGWGLNDQSARFFVNTGVGMRF